jgi:hypothetical protein
MVLPLGGFHKFMEWVKKLSGTDAPHKYICPLSLLLGYKIILTSAI